MKKNILSLVRIILILLIVVQFSVFMLYIYKGDKLDFLTGSSILSSSRFKIENEKWCNSIDDKNIKGLCQNVIISSIEKGECLSENGMGFCIGIGIIRDVWPMILESCSSYNEEWGITCSAKALAPIDLGIAKDWCKKISNKDWVDFCKADVTSKIDIKKGLEECYYIKDKSIRNFCVSLMALKLKDISLFEDGLCDEITKENLKELCNSYKSRIKG